MRAVDHRFALGDSPALPSALSKKSLTRVSSPILACRVFTSTGGAPVPALGSGPNTPAAPSRSWAFHWVIWLGCTSNCWANSARVVSPFTAARATFALKAGEWFRRGRLLMVSPVWQPFWLRSGRNSTYPSVQILRASSIEQILVLLFLVGNDRSMLFVGCLISLSFSPRRRGYKKMPSREYHPTKQ